MVFQAFALLPCTTCAAHTWQFRIRAHDPRNIAEDQNTPTVRSTPTKPTSIQNIFSIEYAKSFFKTEHHDRITASQELNIHTKRNGLFWPSQLTNEKLIIRITTPIISIFLMFRRMNVLIARIVEILCSGQAACDPLKPAISWHRCARYRRPTFRECLIAIIAATVRSGE
jgi:hypothetical protein